MNWHSLLLFVFLILFFITLCFVTVGCETNQETPDFPTTDDDNFPEVGASEIPQSAPAPIWTEGVLNGIHIVGAAAGAHHSLVLSDEGKVYSFGLNDCGQLGDGTLFTRAVPVPVQQFGALYFQSITAIAAGNKHSLLLSATGMVFSFGDNQHGQLGLGEGFTAPQSSPQSVDTSAYLHGKFITQIAAGGYHSLVLTEEGKLFAFGRNDNGQQGDLTTKDNFAPHPVFSEGALSGVVIRAIAAGQDSSLVMAESGQLFSFGKNYYGPIEGISTSPSEIPFVTGVSKSTLSVRNDFGFVIGSKQGLLSFSWAQGNLGKTLSTMDLQVHNGYSQFDAISAGGSHFLLLKDGKVFSVGKNDEGQLGDGTTTSSSVPVPVETSRALKGLKIRAIAAGGSHSLVVAENGRVFGFGNNTAGQTGTRAIIDLNSIQESYLKYGMIGAGVVTWLYVSFAGIVVAFIIFLTKNEFKYPLGLLVVVALFTIPFWVTLILTIVLGIVAICVVLFCCSALANANRETVWINGREYVVRHN